MSKVKKYLITGLQGKTVKKPFQYLYYAHSAKEALQMLEENFPGVRWQEIYQMNLVMRRTPAFTREEG